MQNFLFSKKIATLLLVCFFAAGLYSCDVVKCAKCTVTPPTLNDYADSLVAIDHAIDSATAAEWIERFKANKDSICHNLANGEDSILCNSEAFNKKYILKLLCLNGCIGLRIHFGMDPLFKVHQIITGVDQHGKDLYFKHDPGELAADGSLRSSVVTTGTSYAVETGMGCPSHCP